MRVNKIILGLMCLTLSTQTMGMIIKRGISRSSTSGVPQGGERPMPPRPQRAEVLVSEHSRGESCLPHKTKGQVSLNFLRSITDASIKSPNEITVDEVRDGVYQVRMTKYISTCTDLDFEVAKVGSDYFVKVVNNYDFSEDDVPLKEGERFDLVSDDEKYFRCMKAKGMLTEENSPDWEKAEQQGSVVYSKKSGRFSVQPRDGETSSNIFFASPVASGYGIIYPAGRIRSYPEDWNCTVYENFNQKSKKRLYTSERDSYYDRAEKVCQTESAEKILKELSRLRKSSVGNFRDLERTLEKAFEKAQDKRLEEIYSRMDDIEDEVKDNKRMGEEEAREVGREYSKLAKEINKIVVRPSVERINILLKERKKAHKRAERERIDKEIEKLNKKISTFSKRKTKKLNKLYDKLKEFGLVDEAHDIESLRLASHFYGRVYKKKGGRKGPRGTALTFKQANQKIKKNLKKFEKNHLDKWEMSYAAKQGDKAPARDALQRLQQMKYQMARGYQSYQQQEYKYTKQYCSSNMLGMVTNVYKCNQWMKNKNARLQQYLRVRQNQISYINNVSGEYSGYMNSYQQYMKNNPMDGGGSPGGFMTYNGDGFSSQGGGSNNFFGQGGIGGSMSPGNFFMSPGNGMGTNMGTGNFYGFQNQMGMMPTNMNQQGSLSGNNFFAGGSPYATVLY